MNKEQHKQEVRVEFQHSDGVINVSGARHGYILQETETQYLCLLANFGSLVEEWHDKDKVILE
jgi:hypothetical protein